MRLTFDSDHLERLLDLSEASGNRRANLEQLVDPAFWREDLDPARRTLLEEEIRLHGLAFSAMNTDIDPGKVPAGLHLVGDHGVYIMSNAPIEDVRAAGVDHVAYAAEANPAKVPFDDLWEIKRASFGGDDGVEFLGAEDVRAGIVPGHPYVIDLSPTTIALPARTQDADPAP
ncbi:DUF3085 domain-containing protein [Defluviimonas salinarum]|uniref:DUF3085 domain-containing protein n=1 Tax=Defluviimonas salinarum TaxID=2992147 RepID=A0ABT3J4B4_9RHOB|nr:DUF3085 domain-containing protein [Defluviimonas salinarum]MCW3782508.1 DUF3085 domain-containing protein [Defluviimonas salinarum]